MKEIKCESCGEPIEQGFETNPANSMLCSICYQELLAQQEVDNAGE